MDPASGSRSRGTFTEAGHSAQVGRDPVPGAAADDPRRGRSQFFRTIPCRAALRSFPDATAAAAATGARRRPTGLHYLGLAVSAVATSGDAGSSGEAAEPAVCQLPLSTSGERLEQSPQGTDVSASRGPHPHSQDKVRFRVLWALSDKGGRSGRPPLPHGLRPQSLAGRRAGVCLPQNAVPHLGLVDPGIIINLHITKEL